MMDFNFETPRLIVKHCTSSHLFLEEYKENTILNILTPLVTKALPKGWQNVNTKQAAVAWLKDRLAESEILLIVSKTKAELIGFIFLNPVLRALKIYNIRFGYLLAEQSWRKGLGTEIVLSLIEKSKQLECIGSILGGVSPENIGSIKVLEKCGFKTITDPSNPVLFYEKVIINK